MINHFSIDITRGDVCYPPKEGRLVKMVVRPFFKCRSGGGEAPKKVMKNDDFYRAEKKSREEMRTT